MLSDARNPSVWSTALKAYLFKVRAYSGYLGGLILVQLLAMGLVLSSSVSLGMGTNNLRIVLHTYSSQLVLVFSVVWSFIVSIVVTSRSSKDAVFSFPGSRQTDSLSDLAFMLTCCVFGAVTTAFFGVAVRLELLLVFPGGVLAQGFYPVFGDLCVIAVATFSYMLLLSAAGYFAGTLFRFSKVFIAVVTVLIVFVCFSVLNWTHTLPIWGVVWNYLFRSESLWSFALISAAVAACLYCVSAAISFHMEVKK